MQRRSLSTDAARKSKERSQQVNHDSILTLISLLYFQFHGLLLGIGINNNVLPFGAVIKVIIERYGREYDKDKMAPKGRPTNKKMKVSKICIIISNESLRSPK